MKKLIPVILMICFISVRPGQAQLEQGKILVGVTSTVHLWGSLGSELMSVGFSSTKYGDSDPYKCTHFNILPRGGYFVIDNLAVGLNLLLSTWSEKSSDGDYKESATTIAAGPFVRYYYPMEKIYPFAEINADFGTHIDKYGGNYENKEKWGLFVFGAGVGAAKPIGDRVTLDALIGYTHVSWKVKDVEESEGEDEKTGGVGLRLGFNVFFGPK